MPSVTILSLTPIGRPNNGPRSEDGTFSNSSARSNAFSLFKAKKA